MTKKMTIEDLALITKKGFDDVMERFDAHDKRFDAIESRFSHVEARLDMIEQDLSDLRNLRQEVGLT